MPAAPLPLDEANRLATLASYQILDTPADPVFERLVALAAEHFNVPIAAVSLMDEDRQWFKAVQGLAATEMPREHAFCAHALLQPDELLVVEDAEQDPRFSDNPLVTGDPSFRFYAGAPVRAEDGQPLGTICIIDHKPRRLSGSEGRFLANLAGNAGSMLELHRRNIVLSAESNTDPLTGLANRRAFNAALQAACAALSGGTTFGLLALDLDRFKKINDELGHEVGDKVLIEVAARLNEATRSKDLVARLGGDEFVILAGGPIEVHGLTILAQRIMNAFLPDMVEDELALPIRTSMGIALAPTDGRDPRTLSRAADLALYASKRGGRQAFTIAAPSDAGSHGFSAANALRDAIENATVPLRWQAYAKADTLDVAGYEVAPQWGRSGCAGITQTDIIELGRKSDLMRSLDRLVLRQACAAAMSWRGNLSVAVTLSSCWFGTGGLVQVVNEALTYSGLARNRLRIQLSAEMPMLQQMEQDPVAILRERGIAAVLTDIGSASAALAPVFHFGFDGIKLHPDLVHSIGANARAEAVIIALSGLARGLGITMRADGVTSRQQLHFLQDAGCGLVQGPLIGNRGSMRPEPIARPADRLVAIAAGADVWVETR